MKRLLFLIFILSSCATAQKDYGHMIEPNYQERPEFTQSLVIGSPELLSEASIQKILGSKISLPKSIVLAVLRLAPSNRVMESSGLDASVVEGIYRASSWGPRVKSIIPVPALLLPNPISLQGIRQAGLLLQADMVLVMSPNSQVDWRLRFLRADQAKAQTNLESLLIDVRTGLIPYTHHSQEMIQLSENPEDFNNTEWLARVKFEAEKKTTAKLLANASEFLKAMP